MEQYKALKDKGNQLFSQKKYKQSIQTFQQGLSLIQSNEKQQTITTQTQLGKLFVILNINAAFAAINIATKQSYIQAVKYCNAAIKIDPKNQKGVYRRALALKQHAQLLEQKSQGTVQQILQMYNQSKKDLEDILIWQKTNDLAAKKLQQVIKNIYRVTVTSGKQVNLSGQYKKVQIKSQNKQQPKTVKSQQPIKKYTDMNKIMKEYNVEEVTQIARQKIQSQLMSQQLPKTRSQFQKSIRQIQKQQQYFLKYIYRFTDDYLKSIQPLFDSLLKITNILIKKGQGQQTKNALKILKKQKSFELMWKSMTKKQKQQFDNKCKQLNIQ